MAAHCSRIDIDEKRPVPPKTIRGKEPSNTVRVVEIDGQAWFVARDICVTLSVYIGPKSGQPNVTMAIQKLNEDEFQFNRIELTPGYPRNAVLVSESGLYKIVMRSDKQEARQFQDWVTREVLPAIRKDGLYVTGEEKVKTGERIGVRQANSFACPLFRFFSTVEINPQKLGAVGIVIARNFPMNGHPLDLMKSRSRMDRIQVADRLPTALQLKFHLLRSIHRVNYPYDFECFFRLDA